MTRAYLFLEQLVPSFVLASTCILTLGLLFILTARQPAARQRIGELTVLAVLVWLLLAVLPFRPVDPEGSHSVTAEATSLVLVPETNGEPWAPNAVPPLAAHDDVARIDSFPSEAKRQPASRARATNSWVGFDIRSFTIPPWFVRLYLVASALLGVVVMAGKLLLTQIVRNGAAPPAWLLKTYAEMPVARKARMVVTRRGMPFSCGLVQPTGVSEF